MKSLNEKDLEKAVGGGQQPGQQGGGGIGFSSSNLPPLPYEGVSLPPLPYGYDPVKPGGN